MLARLRELLRQSSPGPEISEPVSDTNLVAYAKHLYRHRRKRDDLFPGLFGEPAWDILLDLYIARAEGRQTSVSSLCIAACVPQTTALRWITNMINDGVLMREPDAMDRRRSLVALTPQSFMRVGGLLQADLYGAGR